MNPIALLAGLVVYAIIGTMAGLLSLGVGFMEEPSRTIAGHAIVFGPFILAGFVVGRIAQSRPAWHAAAVAVISFTAFLALSSGPVPFVLSGQKEPLAQLAQGAYQAILSIIACVAGSWAGARGKPVNAL